MNKPPKKLFGSKIMTVVVLLVALAVVALIRQGRSKDSLSKDDELTFAASQGSLVISLTESGTIEAQDKIVIKSEIEGSTTILWVIDEGTHVKKGDLLVELDSSQLEEDLFTRQLQEQNAKSAFVRTREDLVITKNQADSDIEKAEITLRFAQQDREKYIKGEYPQQLREAEVRITLAKEDLQRSEEKLKWSNVLFEQKLISQTELQADALAAKKALLDLELTEGTKALLEEHTNTRQLAGLASDVKQAEMALERVTLKAKSNILQAETELTGKEADLERKRAKLKEVEEQIKATRIIAPSDGLVLYATSTRSSRHSSQEPLAAGSSVRERESLIHLPDTTKMMASIKIHETNVKKLKIDMPARITVDAIPDKTFRGHVNQIAPLPDPSSFWMNPNLKVYNTEIYIDDVTHDLRNGMSCEVEIISETYTNAIYVPLQCVVKIQKKSTVFVIDKHGKREERAIETGSDNGRMIHVIAGLEEGEKVLLTPPLENSERNSEIPEAEVGPNKGAGQSDPQKTKLEKPPRSKPNRSQDRITGGQKMKPKKPPKSS